MNIAQLLAHAGEEHENAIEASSHLALTTWYIALPLFIVANVSISYIVWILSNKQLHNVLLLEAIVLLVSGFVFAEIVPVISIISLTFGIILAGFLAFVSISDPSS